MMDGYPRVLVVSDQALPGAGATGQTLARLFEGWPEASLAQVCFMPGHGRGSFIGRTFRVPGLMLPADAIARRFSGSPGPAGWASPEAGPSLKSRLRRQAAAVVDIGPVMGDGGLSEWVGAFGPNVIYSALGSVRVMGLALRAASVAHCPIAPHFMDDWPSTLHSNGELFGAAAAMVQRKLKQVLQRARGGLCISAAMAREYEQRYHLPFADVMNCVDEEWFAAGLAGPGRANVQYLYSGGLHLGRDQVLLSLADAIERSDPAGGAELTVCTPSAESVACRFRQFRRTRVRGVAPAEVRETLAGADVLVHVESFEPRHVRYTRLSISTKIPEYLATGRPVLAIGPAELASMQHLAASGAAISVHTGSVDEIAGAVQSLHAASVRQELGRKGRAFAMEAHAAVTVRERFRVRLAETAGGVS